MTPTILPADALARVMFLLSAGHEAGSRGLSESDRRLIESVVGSACLGPVALDEYLSALARSIGDRPGGTAAGSFEPTAWEILLRDGVPGLSDEEALSLAASPDAVRGLNQRVDAALCDGTLTDVWWSLYKVSAARLPDPALDPAVRATFEVFSRLHAERSGRAEAPRPTDADSTN